MSERRPKPIMSAVLRGVERLVSKPVGIGLQLAHEVWLEVSGYSQRDPDRKKGVTTLFVVTLILSALVVMDALDIGLLDRRHPSSQVARLLQSHCWLGYDPLEFNPTACPNPTSTSIQRDLRWIRAAGFTGIVTFSSKGTLAEIPALAKQEGLAVIMGVWTPSDRSELEQAAGQRQFVDAYCVGHNGLGKPHGYTMEELEIAIKLLRRCSGRPVTTSEEARFYGDRRLGRLGDWLFPDVHVSLLESPVAPPSADPFRDVARYIQLVCELPDLADGMHRPLMLKCVVYPWHGAAGASLETQRIFFSGVVEGLRSPDLGLPFQNVSIVVHSAFDSPWKTGFPFYPWDPFTGLLEGDGTPRPAAGEITKNGELLCKEGDVL